MVLQNGIVCRESCWCDMKCVRWLRNGVTWNVVWFGIIARGGVWLDVEWCNVKCGGRNVVWRGARCNGNALYIPHLTDYSSTIFHIEPHFRHNTPYISHHSTYLIPPDHTWRDVDNVVWNLVWCGMFCNARCGTLRLIHPNVVVMLSKVRPM